MIIPEGIRVYGDMSFRGKCPLEAVEQSSIINRIRGKFPDTWGRLVLHPRNEGLVSGGQFSTVIKHAAEGMTKGSSDIVIPGCPSAVIELKRLDHTKSKWQDGQIEYLEAARDTGSFACIALGAVAAWQAVLDWIELQR